MKNAIIQVVSFYESLILTSIFYSLDLQGQLKLRIQNQVWMFNILNQTTKLLIMKFKNSKITLTVIISAYLNVHFSVFH